MLSTTNSKVIRFYQEHPYFSFEEMNIFMVDFFRKLLTQIPNENIDQTSILNLLQNINTKCASMETSITHVNNQQNKMESYMSDIHKQIVDSISLQLYSTKDSYIKELEKFIQCGKTNDLQHQQEIANQNMEKILDKIQLYFGDKFLVSVTDEVKKFNKELHNEFDKAVKTDNNNSDTLMRFENVINAKYDNLNHLIMQMNQDVKKDMDKLNYSEELSVIKTHFERQKNSSNKGADGENKLENVLSELFPSSTIQNMTGKSKSGDFIVEREDRDSIMFENKDYSNNVPVCEVEKFIRDVENLNMHGIFLSQNSGVSRKDDLHIDVHNGNIMIFVHCVNYSVDKIKVAVNMLDHLGRKLKNMNTSGEVISNEILVEINKEFQYFMHQRGLILESMRKFHKDMTKQVTDLQLPELNILLSNKFASTDSSQFNCIHCGQLYKNKKSLAAHTKRCKKAPTKDTETENAGSNDY